MAATLAANAVQDESRNFDPGSYKSKALSKEDREASSKRRKQFPGLENWYSHEKEEDQEGKGQEEEDEDEITETAKTPAAAAAAAEEARSEKGRVRGDGGGGEVERFLAAAGCSGKRSGIVAGALENTGAVDPVALPARRSRRNK